jgi:hypothetical protein
MNVRTILPSLILFALPHLAYAAAVSPAVIDLEGGRGEEVEAAFTVINTQATDQTYYLDTLSFQAKDETGEPRFLTEETSNDLSTWVSFPLDQISVPARSKVDVPFSVQIPVDVSSGSYQSAITVSSAPAEVVATNGAIIEAKTAILVFLLIKGETTKKVALLDFVSKDKSIRSDVHTSFTFRLQNQGNVYAVPEGQIVLKDLFGRKLGAIDINETKQRILPATTRSFQASDQKAVGFLDVLKDQMNHFSIGPVIATLSINFGEGFEPIQTTTSFWYVPHQLILSVFLFVGLLTVGYQILSKHKKT